MIIFESIALLIFDVISKQARETEFRAISYLTSTRVVCWGIITAMTVVASGCFMMKNLKSFFLAKKLV